MIKLMSGPDANIEGTAVASGKSKVSIGGVGNFILWEGTSI
jgi:hypothetical protein